MSIYQPTREDMDHGEGRGAFCWMVFALIVAVLGLLASCGCRTRTEIRVYIYEPGGVINFAPELLIEKEITPTVRASVK